MSYSIYAYPWNLSASNYRQQTEEILALGLQGINLAASYHAGKFIHPPASRHRVYFPEDGVVYFKPRSSYGAIRPVTSKLLEQEDVFKLLTKADDLRVNAWMVLLHNTRLGMLYPHATVRNAFGNRYVYSLCPANPDVRQYALTLCKDLAGSYPVAALLLETPGYLAYGHGFHHEFSQLPPNSWLEAWLGLCFCDHCVNGASNVGIDSLSLQKRVMTAVDGYLNGSDFSSDQTALSWLENEACQDPDLQAFLQWRRHVVTSLAEEIRAGIRPEVKIRIITTTQASHATCALEGHDLAALHRVTDGLETPLYQSSAAAAKTEGKYIIRQVGGAERLAAILRPGWPDMQSREQVVDTVTSVRALGIQDIGFYHYDMLLPVNLRWLKHAITD